MQALDIYILNTVSYIKALDIQEKLLEKRINKEINDTLILLQHPPTFTTGKRGNPENLLISQKNLDRQGITFEKISRGGDITFHGPGQIVGYPIVDLTRIGKDVHKYLRSIEKVLISTLKDFDIEAKRIEKLTGVWVKRSKIASIGVGVRRWVTYHGFALNVNTELEYFDLIVPCGIPNVRMTTIKQWLNKGSDVDMKTVQKVIINKFMNEFEFTNFYTKDPKTLIELTQN